MDPDILRALLDHWPLQRTANTPETLQKLLIALGENSLELAKDTLGERNRKLIALHDQLGSDWLDASVTCGSCANASVSPIPKAALRALPRPQILVAEFAYGDRQLRYRLPTMADFEATSLIEQPQSKRAIIDLCALDSDGTPASLFSDEEIAEIQAKFDGLDPLANIKVESTCPQCTAVTTGSIDIAAIVSAYLDDTLTSLLNAIDQIASEYGWGEAAIVALPSDRRDYYVKIISQRASVSE